MISPAREVACELLCRIELDRAYSDLVLNSRNIAKLEGRDRDLVTEIVYGTLRWQAFVDFLLQEASSPPGIKAWLGPEDDAHLPVPSGMGRVLCGPNGPVCLGLLVIRLESTMTVC